MTMNVIMMMVVRIVVKTFIYIGNTPEILERMTKIEMLLGLFHSKGINEVRFTNPF